MKNILLLLILIILILLTPNRYESFSKELVFTYSVLYLLSLIIFLFYNRNKDGNWFRFDVMFLLGFTIVHFQIPYLSSINIEPLNPSFIWINRNVVNFATWMSSVAIIFWMLGYNFYNNYKFKKKPLFKFDKFKFDKFKFDFLLVLSFVIFLILVGKEFFTGKVQGTDSWGSGAVYLYLIFSKLLYLRIIYFFFELKKRTSLKTIYISFFSNKILAVVYILNIVFFLSIGDRGPVMKAVLILLGMYAIFIRPIKFKTLVLFIILGSFTFMILGLGRGEKVISNYGNENIFERGISEFFEKKDDNNFTDELASSVRIQYRALDNVPNDHPYLLGSTFLFSFTNLIPFGGGLIIESSEIPKIYTDTSLFFTYLGQGNFSTWGEGSEILADIYVNFGIFGVFIVFFIFGFLAKKIYFYANEKNILYIIIYSSFLMSAIYINRSYLLYPLKDVIYMLFFHYLFTKIIK